MAIQTCLGTLGATLNVYMHEQFPPEVVARRRRLIPILWDAKKIGKTALISYDTLYIDGTPVYMD